MDLEKKFIENVLRKESRNIFQEQGSRMQSRGFDGQEWYSGRHFNVTDNQTQMSFLTKHRFVDMKIIRGEKKKSSKVHPIYNQVVMGHYNNIVKELQFGFTEEAKQAIRNNLQQ